MAVSASDKRERRRQRDRERVTGFSHRLVLELRLHQSAACAICDVPLVTKGFGSDSEVADHDHNTLTPRGLLCRACNAVLGTYERHQRARIRIEPYERYLTDTPYQQLTRTSAR